MNKALLPLCPSVAVGAVAHADMHRSSVQEIFVAEEVFGIILSVPHHRVDVDILFAVFRRFDGELLSVLEVQCGFSEQRSACHILVRSRADGVEP